MNLPLMPKATAVWLFENTSLSFKQIADFCNLHILEIQKIANGELTKGFQGNNPIISNQLTQQEIKRCEKDTSAKLKLKAISQEIKNQYKKNKKVKLYIPIKKRHYIINGILWLIQNYPELSDTHISKLLRTTKPTVEKIRNKSHNSYYTTKPKNPISLMLCSHENLKNYIIIAKKIQKKNNK